MKSYMDLDDLETTIQKIICESLDENDVYKYESDIEEYSHNYALGIVKDMEKYVHKKNTHINGNFCNIVQDWECCPEFIGSKISPWGNFREVVKSIDDETISSEDLTKFQIWCKDWFFCAFGTFVITYQFQEMISEMEYNEDE